MSEIYLCVQLGYKCILNANNIKSAHYFFFFLFRYRKVHLVEMEISLLLRDQRRNVISAATVELPLYTKEI
jgi:hypothetical protein